MTSEMDSAANVRQKKKLTKKESNSPQLNFISDKKGMISRSLGFLGRSK